MRRAAGWAAAAISVSLIAAGAAVVWLQNSFDRRGPLAREVTIVLPRGIGLGAIADRLATAGVVDSALVFELGVRLAGGHRNLLAGEYTFSSGISARETMEALVAGRTVMRRLTVPEGLTTREVADLVAGASGLEGPLPKAPAEGSLLPETYYYALGDTRAGVIARMEKGLEKTLAELWQTRDPNLPLASPREALILASVVEKEAALPEERGRIAGVFVNRLRRGMRLQSDPTVVYGITLGTRDLARALRQSDLKAPTPYNTYVVDGLPPGPIANPGRTTIAAVLNPLPTNELYFVADGSGGHAFARTLAEHNRNVARWRKRQRKTE